MFPNLKVYCKDAQMFRKINTLFYEETSCSKQRITAEIMIYINGR